MATDEQAGALVRRAGVAPGGGEQHRRDRGGDRRDQPNRPSQYTWLQPLLAAIAANPPHVADTATGAAGAPLFVVAGACPSVFAGMQVVYSRVRPARGGPPMGVQDPRWAAAAVDSGG